MFSEIVGGGILLVHDLLYGMPDGVSSHRQRRRCLQYFFSGRTVDRILRLLGSNETLSLSFDLCPVPFSARLFLAPSGEITIIELYLQTAYEAVCSTANWPTLRLVSRAFATTYDSQD
jgi:hypothetical protein